MNDQPDEQLHEQPKRRIGGGRYADLTLASYPFIFVRVDCPACPRAGVRHRLARLAAQHGADALLDAVLAALTPGCPMRGGEAPRGPGREYPACLARFPDLERIPPLPDGAP